MLNKIHVLELMEESINNYLKALEMNSLYFESYKAEIFAYMKVLNDEALTSKYTYMDIDKAKELLKDIKR